MVAWHRVAAIVLAAAGIAAIALWSYSRFNARESEQFPPPVATADALHFTGSAKCAGCHPAQIAAWRTSHHAQAMQTATADSVRGDFANVSVGGAGGATRFFQRDGKYFAHLEDPQQRGQDVQIRYTFGVYPLQQYLVDSPGGRLQALSVAWDARPREQGGQRWFSLYPGQSFSPGDALHWTGRDQNWNFMCASCHSTHLQRNYNLSKDTYGTTWSEMNVACEACHGPGSRHVAWAEGAAPRSTDTGLVVGLHASRTMQWGFWSADQKIASPHGDLTASKTQSQICFPCHARRQALVDEPVAGHPFLDDYLPQLIEAGVYRADGQIDAEDFEFGSFVQSKMYVNGVTCTNCHDAHSLQLRATGNALCTQCHRADHYDQPTHHHHSADSAGAQCINCHMPTKTYMGVDQRRDHSFRIPRPDLSVSLGVPNACTQCHSGKQAAWAVASITRWTGHVADTGGHFANGIDNAWSGARATESLLATLAAKPAAPGIVRASSLALLSTQAAPTSESLDALDRAAKDPDPLVRLGAARGIAGVPSTEALRIGAGLLDDPQRAVRVEAARSLAGTSEEGLPAELPARLRSAVDELIATELTTSERPESHVNLAQIYARLGRNAEAEQELNTALRLDHRFVPAMVNLADLDRAQGRENEAEQWLHQAVALAPDAAEPAHALGLLEVRRGRRDQALGWLKKAVQLDPGNARYLYVYAIALTESGQRQQAASAVTAARRRLPKDDSLLELQKQLAQSR